MYVFQAPTEGVGQPSENWLITLAPQLEVSYIFAQLRVLLFFNKSHFMLTIYVVFQRTL